jgi:hypothetical protein
MCKLGKKTVDIAEDGSQIHEKRSTVYVYVPSSEYRGGL